VWSIVLFFFNFFLFLFQFYPWEFEPGRLVQTCGNMNQVGWFKYRIYRLMLIYFGYMLTTFLLSWLLDFCYVGWLLVTQFVMT
jgi:hypothetical protein